mgnify:CR=1 FL=1
MIESHSILGLTFAALIYIVSLTGAFTLFVEEIAVWENADAPTAERVSAQAYQAALAKAGRGEITTEIAALGPFYYAEDYHQGYLAKNPAGYCGIGGTGVVCPIGAGAPA